ncbi:MAG: oligosaccharide flippase family protein [Candidatus Parcubacteria bacterium]|nr:oligosaccharide flippase family protein [Candidatus Parcubacteria bacterium]
MSDMPERIRRVTVRALRWSEKYTKTDMVYLASVGLWTNLNFVITTVLALLLSVAFANLLPREVYGNYQYLLSLSALLGAICLTGMGGAVAQSVARGYEGDLRAGVAAQLWWNLVPTTIGLAGAAYYALHGNGMLAIGLVIIALLAPNINAFGTYSTFLAGKREFKRSFVYGILINMAYYAAIFLSIYFFKDATVLIFVNLAVNLAVTIFAYVRTLRIYAPNDRTDPETIPYGAHLSVMNAFSTIISQLDSVLVFHFLGPVQLAVYSFATMIPERFGAALNFIGTAAYPKFATRTLVELRDTIISKTFRAALAGAAGALVYILAAPFLFGLLFPKYLDVIPYTQLYAVIIILLPANLVSIALQAQRLKTELYVTSFVSPILLITLQIPLLLAYGILGMLVARIITDAANVVIGIVLLFRATRRNAL